MQVSEVELSYRTKVKATDRVTVKTSQDAYKVFIQTWDQNRIEFVEQFKVLLVNRANKVSGIYELSSCGITGTVADPSLIFIAALKTNACNIILS